MSRLSTRKHLLHLDHDAVQPGTALKGNVVHKKALSAPRITMLYTR